MGSNIILIGDGLSSDIDYNLVINHLGYNIDIIMTKLQHNMIYALIRTFEYERTHSVRNNIKIDKIIIEEILKII